MEIQPTFILDGSTLATMGGVILSLTGAILALFRALIVSKDQQINSQFREMESQRKVMMEEIQQLKVDRNYFRDKFIELSSRQSQVSRRQ